VNAIVLHLGSTTSTNDVAIELARQGALEGTVVVAERQTAGRGRRGRVWLSPPGKCLLCSVILRPQIAPSQAALLTMLASVAAAQAIRQAGAPAVIKWPNDILLNGRKLGGILVETEISGQRISHAVIGLGINVNVPAADLAAIAPQATSLLAETGHRFARPRLLRLLINELSMRHEALAADPEAIYNEWLSLLDTIGRELAVDLGNETLRGCAEGAGSDGALLVRLADGRLVAVTHGDVS
jgi:BirA family transcriptional regulator, biotin operon repressor / biotin---[acetyl-CoA-carboxylase] ligase